MIFTEEFLERLFGGCLDSLLGPLFFQIRGVCVAYFNILHNLPEANSLVLTELGSL